MERPSQKEYVHPGSPTSVYDNRKGQYIYDILFDRSPWVKGSSALVSKVIYTPHKAEGMRLPRYRWEYLLKFLETGVPGDYVFINIC